MQRLSIVISEKNAAETIATPLESFKGLTDDIIVYDNGSTDNTSQVVQSYQARFINGEWKGFGETKNDANDHAKYDWVLSLDADESIDERLKKELLQLKLDDDKNVYEFNFKTFLGNKWVRYGEWGVDRHIRLFNRQQVKWDKALVHEQLILPPGYRVITLPGYVLHRTVKNKEDYEIKMRKYALMNAEKYYHDGKRTTIFKKYFSSAFSFLRNYIFRLGFLDGKEGFFSAKMTAMYTYLKYKKLEEMRRSA